MPAPTDLVMTVLTRLCLYLVSKPRLLLRYVFQESDSIECYSDTDWAGCPRTHKSTPGGVLLLGQHILKTYSSTQPIVSLSRGEADFYAVVEATGAALGQKSLCGGLRTGLWVCVWTDSLAAIGISSAR